MQSYSQAGQDRFVAAFGITDGWFLDVGCSHPVVWNNTYALEQAGWTGLLVDYDPNVGVHIREKRRSPFLQADVTTLDWAATIARYAVPPLVDYLSFDLDAAGLSALRTVPWARIRFRILTVEHDVYRFGGEVRAHMRDLLLGQGYDLLCPDVMHTGLAFEDWWVDAKLVDDAVAARFRTSAAADWSAIVGA